jgi:hypothetical protein
MMKYIFDITPYNTLKVNGNFGGTYHFHPQVFRVSQAKNKHVWQAVILTLFLLGLILTSENGGDIALRKSIDIQQK